MNKALAMNLWYRAGTIAANVFVLNLLWLVCSLPLVTLPASTMAVFGTVRRFAHGEESVVGPFFQEWRRRAGMSYALGLPTLAVAVLLYVEIEYYSRVHDVVSLLMLGMTTGFTLVFASIAGHLYPVAVACTLPARDMLRTAFYLGIRRFLPFACTIFPVWIAGGLLLMAVPALLFAGVVPVAAWLTYAAADKQHGRQARHSDAARCLVCLPVVLDAVHFAQANY
jgi:uncharacterized membrane protein YesL